MAKGKTSRKKQKKREHPTLSEEDRVQLRMLLDRVAVQDPEGETFPQYLESVTFLVSGSSPFALAFIEALGEIASPVSVEILQALQKVPAEKRVRRAIKTALYHLARQGLVPEVEEKAASRVLVPRPADRQAEAWASWPESQGERGMVLKLPDAGRGYLMAIGVLNSDGVFHEFEVFQTTRKGVRALLERMTGGVSDRLIEIPMEHVHFLYEEVAEVYRRQNMELPAGYDVIYKQLSSLVRRPAGPHIYNLLNEKEIVEDTLLLRTSDSLLEVQPFASWRLPEELVRPYVEQIKDLSESRLVISQSAQLERVTQIYREAAAEIFTPEIRQRYRRLLEETALLLYLEDQEQEAKRALAVTLDLEKGVGYLTEDNFILGLVKRSIAAEVGPGPEDAEAHTQREKITESGLIIPR